MKFAIALVSLAFVGTAAYAGDDVVNSHKDTVEHSKNPITGTKKTVTKHKSKTKDAAGNEAEATVTKTTKVHKDGEVEKKTEVDAESSKH